MRMVDEGACVIGETDQSSGNLKLSVNRNGDNRGSLFLMKLGSKNVFVEQLPNLPRPYVRRLVLDRRHRSLMLLQEKYKE